MSGFTKSILFIIVFLVLAWAVNSFLASATMMELLKEELDEPNPTSYIYNAPPEEVREAIRDKFGLCGFRKMDLTGPGINMGERDSSVDMKYFVLASIFSYESYLYRTNGRGRFYRYRLELHLDSLAPHQTRVRVITKDNEIISGYKPGIAHMSFIVPIVQQVTPSTIEEYQVLYKLGKQIGMTDMPRVEYPEKLDKEYLLKTYYNAAVTPHVYREYLNGNSKDIFDE